MFNKYFLIEQQTQLKLHNFNHELLYKFIYENIDYIIFDNIDEDIL